MRMIYGIHGYGRGHATRALAVLPELRRRHKVRILAGGDAHDALAGEADVVRIPTLGYHYRANGTRSNLLTFTRNLPGVIDLIAHGPAFQLVRDAFLDFRPDAVISDAEPWTHRVAAERGVPRIGFDHFGVLAYCSPPVAPLDRVRCQRDAWVYRCLMGDPQRVIVSSFYDAPARRPGVCFVGPLLRPEVFEVRAAPGDALLAYFNKGAHLFSPRIEGALRRAGAPVIVYGTPRRGVDGNLDFRPPSNRGFLEDLAGCRAVISTAGNQLVGEALHFGKPLLVVPEDCVEQRINARAVERMGIGMRATQNAIGDAVLTEFLRRRETFAANIRRAARDGRRESLAALERFLFELTGIETPVDPAARVA
ncbi:MAG: glycosyltransferase family protein [Phycisphaerae bacterium]